ncbi:nucleolar protein 56 [Coccinella septempunctata]|uniref:nucleolar protein 56 n=1 Tax=Coccinella septempunctata TaxID=41139 RepID=UPI001D085267|nr:nucleolar protein 56 [Coccinella septempunctata]
MSKLYVLFEHAAGYAVFKVKEFEEIGVLLPQLEASVYDVSKFNSIVQLESFSPFKTAVAALENVNAISEGIVPEDLKQFLDITLPAKRKKVKLGVNDPKLGAAITEVLDIDCDHAGAVPEVLRGVRFHFHHFIKELTLKSSGVAQLGLGHAYSRGRIKFNVHRVDNMIIQSIALLDQYDKSINTMTMRLREWFSYNFPELIKIVPENFMFARLIKFIKNRKELTDDSLEELEKITMDSGKAQAILDASRSSMGMDISPVDLSQIEMLADRVISSTNLRQELSQYLRSRMSDVAPNLAALIGDQVGARLISHAGSLTKLAKCPASTVQILGAEKALFRALKTRSNTPKYGLLFHSSFIGRAGTKNKGRISRYLANKCAIASRIDCFSDEPSSVFGEKLKQQVEDRLKFYETGDIPKKNIEVMQEAIEEQVTLSKSMKEEAESTFNGTADTSEINNGIADDGSKKKKKKKRKHVDESMETSQIEDGLNGSEESPKKKKKKHVDESMDISQNDDALNGSEEPPKKKKKKKGAENLDESSVIEAETTIDEEQPVKKKKKKSKKNEAEL